MIILKEIKETLINLCGSSYEVGSQIGTWALTKPNVIQKMLLPPKAYPQCKVKEIQELLDEYCSGINEEIQGFADTVDVSVEQVIFYAMTYLERGCSLLAALPGKTEDGHTLLARNYDFNDGLEEMCFAYTEVKGKYRHIGSTLNLFGRCDGMNEHGLAACKASNGLPVGNFEGGQKAGVTGFNFWIVIRSILENCKNVQEAIDWTMNAPIGYNISLMVADKNNHIALLQCIDGHKAYRILDQDSAATYLSATNHTVLDEIKPYEKMIIDNSVVRNNTISEFFQDNDKVSKSALKHLLSSSYPNGLCCHYYEEFFGTLRSMIFDVTEQCIEMTFGSPQANEWHTFFVEPLVEKELSVLLPQDKANADFYKIN